MLILCIFLPPNHSCMHTNMSTTGYSFKTHKHIPAVCIHTVAFHALVYQPIQERATVVTKGGAGVGVDPKLVFTTRILRGDKEEDVFFKRGLY